MAAVAESRRHRSVKGQHRYGMVFGVVLALVIFQILAPAADWSRAIDVALTAAALTVAVSTSRDAAPARRRRSMLVAGVGAIFVLGIATGVFGQTITFLVATALLAAIPFSLVGGLVRLVREKGVTLQVVAGALAIYLLLGLMFAAVIALVSHIESGTYFKQGGEPDSVDVYYSFTVMTTTGFGDYTAAHPFGHALAVLEMLTGQLYLVTVIGIVVGNFAGRAARGSGGQAEMGSLESQ